MNKRVGLIIALGSVIVSTLLFALSYPIVGDIAGTWIMLATIISGWFLGMLAAFAIGLLSMPLSYLLYHDVISTYIAATIAAIAIGVATAWVKRLVDLFKQQSDELINERARLQEQIARRKQAEESLLKANDNLESLVMERTAQLKETNDRLQVELGERKRAEGQLAHSALHDPLTDLPNRALFMDRLDRAMERAKRHQEHMFVVLYLDLDRFKVVNDSLGHYIGDQLLIESARRLAECLRAEDTVARLGGDEFVILLEDIQDITEATSIADRIQHDLALPCDLEQHKVFISVSIGIVLSAIRYERSEDVLRDADIAMYRAKALGRGRYEVFDTAMRERAVTRLELETDLRGALERQEFFIHYQPIVSLGTDRIVGFEALVRWQHPSRGVLSPGEFILLAEETGLIVPIGQWVLREACRQMREWQARYPINPPLTISVNFSAKQFGQSDLVQKIAQVLQESGLDASSLKLELTESMIVEDAEAVSVVLAQLRALGVQVQIDDFGAGYSTLSYLHRLPIDTLKIDRTFVGRIGVNGNGSEIVRTILALAHDLGMKVIAEGVETADQLFKLKGLDCEYGQGFLFAKPADGKAAGALIAESFAMGQSIPPESYAGGTGCSRSREPSPMGDGFRWTLDG